MNDLQWIKDNKRVGYLISLERFTGRKEWKYAYTKENFWGETVRFSRISGDYDFCRQRITFEMNEIGATKRDYDCTDLNNPILGL